MVEKQSDILEKLDQLVDAAMVEDYKCLIDGLSQYDNYISTRILNKDGVYEKKFVLKGIPKKNENFKECKVLVTRLSNNILQKYIQKSKTDL